MTKDCFCMYGSIKSLKIVDGLLKFCNIIVKHQARIEEVGFYCPYVKRDNVLKVNSFDILREYIRLCDLGTIL